MLIFSDYLQHVNGDSKDKKHSYHKTKTENPPTAVNAITSNRLRIQTKNLNK